VANYEFDVSKLVTETGVGSASHPQAGEGPALIKHRLEALQGKLLA